MHSPSPIAPVLRRLGLVCALTFATAAIAASSDRWESAIQAFEKQDRATPPRPGAIVFYGSSTFTGWNTLIEDFAPLSVVNRGFGGSRPDDAIAYLDRAVVPHQPRAVVLYTGGNEIGRKTPAQIRDDVARLFALLRAALPDTRLVLLSLKPTLARLDQSDDVQAVNRLYAALVANTENARYVDLWSPFVDAEGRPAPEWLAPDGLHPSSAAYHRMAELIRPHVSFEPGTPPSFAR